MQKRNGHYTHSSFVLSGDRNQLILQHLQRNLIDVMIRWIVIAEVQVAARIANERIVVVIVENRNARLEQSARGGQRGNSRAKRGVGTPNRHQRIQGSNICVVNGNAADQHVLIVAAVELVVVLAANQHI